MNAANANIEILDGESALRRLTEDMRQPGNVFAWIYLADNNLAREILSQHNAPGATYAILDHRMAETAKNLQARVPNFHAWTWSYNRTMHDKTWMFPDLGVTYIGTQNLTRGSYWLSRNRAARIDHAGLTRALLSEWSTNREKAKKVQTHKLREEQEL